MSLVTLISKIRVLLLFIIASFFLITQGVFAQSVSTTIPEIITNDDELCINNIQSGEVCISIPDDGAALKVDVFLLLDDTQSFASQAFAVQAIFNDLLNELQAELPGVDLAFGIGRFEDYGFGGSSDNFSGATVSDRPFILNQPILSVNDAGGNASLNSIISLALDFTAVGQGGDIPETSLGEALFQVASGVGFDGDGDGQLLGLGFGVEQPAGDIFTQLSPDFSGDIPPFSSLVPSVLSSGTIGGAGFREDALKLVILATDTCPVVAVESDLDNDGGIDPIPVSITAANGVTVPLSDFFCANNNRVGYISDSKTLSGNTIPGAVAPAGAASIFSSISALNAQDIRVIGLAAPNSQSLNPQDDPDSFLTALARLTNAIDSSGTPLVFPVGDTNDDLKNSLREAILEASGVTPVFSVVLTENTNPAELAVTLDETPIEILPGETGCFPVTLEKLTSEDLMASISFTAFDSVNGSLDPTIMSSITCEQPQNEVCGNKVLFVKGRTSRKDGDLEYIFRLRNLGLDVTTIRESHLSDSFPFEDFDLIVVSSSVYSKALARNVDLTSVPVPMVLMEHFNFVDYGLSAEHVSPLSHKTSIEILPETNSSILHGIMPGVTQVLKKKRFLTAAIPGGDAIVLATVPGHGDKSPLIAYEVGTELANGSIAQARRSTFFARNHKKGNFTAVGGDIFEKIVIWSLENNVCEFEDLGPVVEPNKIVFVGSGKHRKGQRHGIQKDDKFVIEALESAGYTVEWVRDRHFEPNDTIGAEIVMISSTTYSKRLKDDLLTEVRVPIISWEGFFNDDLLLGNHPRISPKVLTFDVIDDSVLGLTLGAFPIYQHLRDLPIMLNVAPGALVLGVVPEASNAATFYLVDEGEELIDGSLAEGLRIAFPMRNVNSSRLTVEGLQLLLDTVVFAQNR